MRILDRVRRDFMAGKVPSKKEKKKPKKQKPEQVKPKDTAKVQLIVKQ
jgi:hypothetical protein